VTGNWLASFVAISVIRLHHFLPSVPEIIWDFVAVLSAFWADFTIRSKLFIILVKEPKQLAPQPYGTTELSKKSC